MREIEDLTRVGHFARQPKNFLEGFHNVICDEWDEVGRTTRVQARTIAANILPFAARSLISTRCPRPSEAYTLTQRDH